VLVGDVERMIDDPALAPSLRAPCWIFGDSLEHLRDPWQVLRLHSQRPALEFAGAALPGPIPV
jgi:hypothetical protein